GTVSSEWVCPKNEEVRRYVKSLISEVALKYDVDGVHLDYIRYPNRTYCYCNKCKESWVSEHPDEPWPPEPTDPTWIKMRQDVITSFVEETRMMLKGINPKIRLSAAVFPVPKDAINNRMQNYPVWAANGTVDFIAPMTYSNVSCGSEIENWLKEIVKVVNGKTFVYAGIGLHKLLETPDPIEEFKKQVNVTRKFVHGYVLFRYGLLEPFKEDIEQVNVQPAIPPHVPGPSIVQVYINKEDVKDFKIEVLNPEYSPSDATITGIEVGLEGELFEVVETEPPIEDGILIPRGESLNITCWKLRKGDAHFSWREIASMFSGEIVTIHVLFQEFPAVSREVKLPYVKLYITPEFDAKVSFRRFNITITNDHLSEVNLTIRDVLVFGVNIEYMVPDVRTGLVTIQPNESICFRFNGSWHGVVKTTISVLTAQGYVFREVIELEAAYALILSVDFYEEHPDYFNVTVYNLPESDVYVNVTKITCKLANGTIIERHYPSVGIMPNSTLTLKFDMDWTGHMGEIIEVQAYFLQDFETSPFSAEVVPEFSFTLLLITFISASLIVAILKKRSRKYKGKI
ncbi:family 10 glycosylhydrolase, partial [Candidatus Bathyarchaeota archaeon]|nr:family 10 glycosylhydrolase [Candidatus Bathyarchaeota archaeon]